MSIFFKNVQVLQLDEPWMHSPQETHELLGPLTFKACLNHLPSSHGWVAPIESPESRLIYSDPPFLLLCMRIEEKILPARVIKEHLAQEVQRIKKETGRTVRGKEKTELKEEIRITLLPHAFTQSFYVHAYVDTEKNWLILDTVQEKRCALFLDLLNRSLSCTAHPFDLVSLPPCMTAWVRGGQQPNMLGYMPWCVLESSGDHPSTVRVKNKNVSNQNIQSFLKEGDYITELGLEEADVLRFVLKEQMHFSRLQFLHDASHLEAPEIQFVSDFAIMTRQLRPLIEQLLQEFSKTQSHHAD